MYYKYLSIERLTYLEDELIRFTQPDDLNDPFECLPQKPNENEFVNLIDEITEMVVKDKNPLVVAEFKKMILKDKEEILSGNPDNWFNKIFDNARKNINKEIGILSLSKNWNNALMWSHYTNSHKGFCVGFDTNHPFFENFINEDGTSSKTIREVTYSEERVKIPMSFSEKKIDLEPFVTKSVDWKYEDEVRIISSLNLAEKIIKSEPNDIYLFILSHSAISEITVGRNMSSKDRSTIFEFCNKKGIDFYDAKISNIKFDMERKQQNGL